MNCTLGSVNGRDTKFEPEIKVNILRRFLFQQRTVPPREVNLMKCSTRVGHGMWNIQGVKYQSLNLAYKKKRKQIAI